MKADGILVKNDKDIYLIEERAHLHVIDNEGR